MIDRPHHVDLDYLTTHDLGRDVHETLSMEIFGDFFNVVLMNIALRALRSQEWWDSSSCIAVRVVMVVSSAVSLPRRYAPPGIETGAR
jgi:hypothetical protein